jgi:internalin A
MTDREPRKRWLPRLTLRALMLLILLSSFWLVRQINKAREQRAVVAAVKKFGGWVHYGPDFVGADPVYVKRPSVPAWLRRWVGEEYFQDLTHVSLAYDGTNKTFQENKNENDCSEILSQLSSINELKSLWMRKWQATDEGLGFLRRNEGLEVLLIFEARSISDKGVMQVKDLVNLRTLILNGSRMTDDGLLALARMSRMEHLSLNSHRFTDHGILAVKGMKRLKYLSLEGHQGTKSDISDVGLVVLQELTNLENLNLSYTRVTDIGLVNLSGLKKLRELHLAHCDISDKRIEQILNLKSLEYLDISGSKLTYEGLACLRGLPKLTFLIIHHSRVTPEGIQKLKAALPQVTVL